MTYQARKGERIELLHTEKIGRRMLASRSTQKIQLLAAMMASAMQQAQDGRSESPFSVRMPMPPPSQEQNISKDTPLPS
uniref:Uncharacterized protein n=1 Tax=Ditylenchus dipsaci TaxID=166011 RepID=A0A915CQF1_9BILA